MKKILLTIAVAALFMFGCQDQNSIVQPKLEQNKKPTLEFKVSPSKIPRFNLDGHSKSDTTKTDDVIRIKSRYGWDN